MCSVYDVSGRFCQCPGIYPFFPGRFPTIKFQITNDDPSSSMGAQTIGVYNVLLTKIPIIRLDDSAESLQEDISFTFNDFEVLKWFNDQPSQLGK